MRRRLSPAELFAVIVSSLSLAIAVLGNRTQERLLAASVWPYLSFASGNTADDGTGKVIALGVENAGNGPARIRRFALEYAGEQFSSASELLARCCELKADWLVTSPIVGKVLRPGEQIRLLQLPWNDAQAEGWRRLDRARFKFVYTVCYCSTLDECWESRSDGDEPKPVATCPAMTPEQQWHG